MRSPLPTAAAAVVTALALAAPAGATPQRTATSAAAAVPATPMVLPGDAGVAAHAIDRSTWIVGAAPGAAATRLARAAGARAAGRGAWEVPVGRARSLAAALRGRGLLRWAEPNRRSELAQAVTGDPLSGRTNWRNATVDPALVPPPVTPESPLLALVDARAEKAHPEFAQDPNANVLTPGPVTIGHGTSTMAVAAAPQNGIGMVGIWPGMRALNVPIPAESISCADSSRGIDRAVKAGASVINMSYGSGSYCQAEYEALQRATKKDVVLVAAGGNELTDGNPLEFPASLPHVLTVAATTPQDTAASFSNANAAIDLSAPGVGITTAVPAALPPTEGGDPSGYADLAGTSFAAPMVAAAATWVRQARPDLSADQVEQVVRLSARDINTKGYDSSTGFGKLDLPAALTKAPPLAGPDPQEPNDDIPYVNGKRFGSANDAIWKGGRERRLEATIDYYEDPADVYRVRVPARQTVRVVLRRTSTQGNPDLAIYGRTARSLRQTSRRLGRSRHSAGITDVLRWKNEGRRSEVVFVRVSPAAPSRSNPFLDAKYELRVGKG